MSSFLALLAKRLRLNGREWLTRAACAPWWTQRGWSMALEEDVVLPTAHAQQNFAQQRDMVPVLGIDGDLRGGAERNLIGGHVVLDLDEDMSRYQLPVGAAAQVAIYTKYWHHVALLRKILLRMRSWENYVFIEGH